MALRGRLFPIPTPQARPPQEELAPGGEDWQAEGALRAAPFVPLASSVFSLGLPLGQLAVVPFRVASDAQWASANNQHRASASPSDSLGWEVGRRE